MTGVNGEGDERQRLRYGAAQKIRPARGGRSEFRFRIQEIRGQSASGVEARKREEEEDVDRG